MSSGVGAGRRRLKSDGDVPGSDLDEASLSIRTPPPAGRGSQELRGEAARCAAHLAGPALSPRPHGLQRGGSPGQGSQRAILAAMGVSPSNSPKLRAADAPESLEETLMRRTEFKGAGMAALAVSGTARQQQACPAMIGVQARGAAALAVGGMAAAAHSKLEFGGRRSHEHEMAKAAMNEISQQIRQELERGAAAHSQAAPGSPGKGNLISRAVRRARRHSSDLPVTKSPPLGPSSDQVSEASVGSRDVLSTPPRGQSGAVDTLMRRLGGNAPPRLASPAPSEDDGGSPAVGSCRDRSHTGEGESPPLRGVRSKSSPGAPKVVSPMRPTPPERGADRPPHACTPANSRLLQKNWSSEGDNMVTPFVGDAGLGDQSTSSPVLLPNERGSEGETRALPTSYEACAAAAVLTAEGAAIADAAKRPALTPANSLIEGSLANAPALAEASAGLRDSAGSGVSEPSSVGRPGGVVRTLGGVTEETTLEANPSSARSAWKSPIGAAGPSKLSRVYPAPTDDGGGGGGGEEAGEPPRPMLSPHGDLPHGQGPTASHKGLWRLAAKLYRPKHFQDIHAQAVAHQGTLKYIGNTQMHGRSSSRVQVPLRAIRRTALAIRPIAHRRATPLSLLHFTHLQKEESNWNRVQAVVRPAYEYTSMLKLRLSLNPKEWRMRLALGYIMAVSYTHLTLPTKA